MAEVIICGDGFIFSKRKAGIRDQVMTDSLTAAYQNIDICFKGGYRGTSTL